MLRGLSALLFLNFSQGSIAVLWKTAGQWAPEIRKAGRLGNDRPSLGARLGVGLSKPWGVWEGGFDERLGGPPAGYVDLCVSGAFWWERCQSRCEKPFRYELQERRSVSNKGNLTKELPLRHLQNCISDLEDPSYFRGFAAGT